ncbi:hypothetical protein [Asanoa siamensis]|uniref:ABC-2 type transport system ATP-binding protein n=1 Tax=Asanoa siamensis TaxID=926357 RepID=A0ABQ4D4V7_9ACTN|nr:hypothetical protein [Asanoa siamensis]GIF78573.1 hypothetical protein Asi02nite_80910 [Asanoa siamensis]
MLLSSHVISDLAEACDWLIVVNDGRVQVAGDVEELIGSHQALSGPIEAADALPASISVVSRRTVGRQARLLVRTDRPVFDPHWTSTPLDMAELVVSYLREPDAAALPRPTLATATTDGDR